MRTMSFLTPLLALSVLGCGSSEFDMVPVSGIVTLDGKPVSGARVIFSPQRSGQDALSAGPASDGKTDDDGRYSLASSIDGTGGAVVGSHTVTISTYLAESDRSRDTYAILREEEIPQKYNEPGALTVEVPPGGSDTVDFELHSQKK